MLAEYQGQWGSSLFNAKEVFMKLYVCVTWCVGPGAHKSCPPGDALPGATYTEHEAFWAGPHMHRLK